MRHTPGPWTYDESEDAIMDSEENRLARVNYAHFEDSYFENCRLIAAAPELLEALKATLNALIVPLERDVTAAITMTRAAIAKATGGAA